MKKNITAVVLIALLASAVSLWFSSQGDRGDSNVPIVGTSVEAAASTGDLEAPDAVDQPARIEAESRTTAIAKAPAEEPEAEAAEKAATAPRAKPKAPRESGALEVTVVTPDGEPVIGADVSVQALVSRLTVIDRQPTRRGATDAQGQAQIRSIPWGLVYATASVEGWATAASEPVNLTASQASGSVRIQLSAGGVVEGHLMDVDGAPASGVRLSIHLKKWPGQVNGLMTSYFQQTSAGEDGHFRFDGLPAGPYTLYTRPEAAELTRVPNQQIELEVVDGQTTRAEFNHPGGAYVEVTGLVLLNGEPLASARINVSYADRSRDRLGRRATSDENGRFTVILDEPDDYRFQVSAALGSRGSAFHTETVPPGSTYEFVIPLETGTIAGRIHDADGNPAASVALTAFGKSPDRENGSTILRATSDANGDFEFASAPVGTYKIQAGTAAPALRGLNSTTPPAHLGGAEVTDIRIRAGEHITDIDIHLTAASAVEGVVKDAAGDPVGSARVECWPTRSGSRARSRPVHHLMVPKAQSSRDGTFQVGGLSPGEHRVRAITARGISPWVEVRVDPNATATAELTVRPGTLLTVNVLDTGEQGGKIHASVVDSAGVSVASGILKDGSITLGPLLPDAYVVKAREIETKAEAKADITLDGGGERTISLTLD